MVDRRKLRGTSTCLMEVSSSTPDQGDRITTISKVDRAILDRPIKALANSKETPKVLIKEWVRMLDIPKVGKIANHSKEEDQHVNINSQLDHQTDYSEHEYSQPQGEFSNPRIPGSDTRMGAQKNPVGKNRFMQ
jgi:hypothetical protein